MDFFSYSLVCDLNEFSMNFEDSFFKANPDITQMEYLRSNEQRCNELKKLLDRMTDEYKKTHDGKSWDDNEVYKLCYDMLTGEHTSDRHPGDDTEISYIFRGKDGRYAASIRKPNMTFDFSDQTSLLQGTIEFTPTRTFYIDDNSDYEEDSPETVEHEDDER